MVSLTLYNKEGKEVGQIDLKDQIFGLKPDKHLLHEVITMYLANRRSGTACTRTRGEVSGGGRKPWRQKGTGRARHGSIRSPLWRGGGTVFGPLPRDYSYSVPKKVKRLALRHALAAKLESGELIVVDELKLEKPKTREMVSLLKNLSAENKPLIVLRERDRVIEKSADNIEGAKVVLAQNLNAYDLLKHNKVIFTKDAVAKMEEALAL